MCTNVLLFLLSIKVAELLFGRALQEFADFYELTLSLFIQR